MPKMRLRLVLPIVHVLVAATLLHFAARDETPFPLGPQIRSLCWGLNAPAIPFQAVGRLAYTFKWLRGSIFHFDEAQLLRHPALEQLPLLLNFDMDSSHCLTLLLVGEPLLRRTLSLQIHEPLRQRIAVQYHLEGLSRDELDAYLTHQLKAAGVSQPLLDETARQALYQATKGILRKVNKLVMTALRLAAARKVSAVNEAILLDATTEALL
jgi:type II secretory pathway predicted ATPase ExeA